MRTTAGVESSLRPESAPTAQKRTGGSLNERPPKRRSSRACLSCRNRKVRCDVLNGGTPCTNCRLDGVECILKQSGRRRRREPSTTQAAELTASPHPVAASPVQQQVTPPSAEPATDYLVSLTFEDQNHQSDSQDGEEDSQDDIYAEIHHLEGNQLHPENEMRSPAQSNRNSTNAPISPQRMGRRSQGSANGQDSSNRPSGERLENDVNTPLPPYIKRLPRHIRERDVQYLTEKDALTIPDDEFRDELLRTYVKIIHTFMPALDLDKLIMPVIRSDGSDPVSLLLFQAVMFASVIFVNSEILRSRGFSSRKAARKVFFNRVRILYGLDCEPDRLTLVQALLLMTYWYDSPDDEKDTWYWMGIALSLTQVLGLHRDPETSNLSLQEKRLRRRIWWSCYIRDRALALGIRRPARIREGEYLVSMLKLDDFDVVQPSLELVGFFKACGFTTVEEDRRKAICQICIELAKLCVCIGEILHTQYSVISREPINYESCKNIAVLPRDPNQQMLDLTRCDSMLEEWNINQKATSRYSPPTQSSLASAAGNDGDDWVEKLIWLHQALLRMTYLSAIGALHRPRALTSLSSPSVSSPGSVDMIAAKKASMQKVREAAVSMTNLAFDLQSKNFLRYLSTNSVPAFLSATLIHLLDVRDSHEDIRNLAIGRFYQCFHALYELQDMYASADYAIRFLKTVLKRVNVNMPMLAAIGTFFRAGPSKSSYWCPLDDHSTSEYENFHIPLGRSQCGTPINTSQFSAPPVSSIPMAHGEHLGDPFHFDPDSLLANFGSTPNVNLGAQTGVQGTSNYFPDQLGVNTPHMEIWNGADGLLPALIQLDTDLATPMVDQEVRISSTSWRSYP